MQRLFLAFTCLLAAATSTRAAPYTIDIPAGWKDTTFANPDVDPTKARLAVDGNTAEVQHHTAPDGATAVLVTFVETYPRYTSRALLDTFERDARAAAGREVSYQATDDAVLRTIVQVNERDGKQLHTRRQVGFWRGTLRSAAAACTGDAAACAPVLTSLKLDTSELTKLADLRATTPPPRDASSAKKMTPFELGMRIGFIVGIPLALFLLYRRWRKRQPA